MPRPHAAAIAGAAAGVLAAAVAWRALWHEPRHGRIRERELRLPGWPASLDGLRVGLISDLHTGAPHVGEKRIKRLVAAVNECTPDLTLLLGDFVDPTVRGGSPVAPEAVARRLGALRARLGVVAVLGNHDWHHGGERIAAALRDAGIRVLEDEAVDLGALHVAGLADARMRRPDVGIALRDVPPEAPVLLLSHDPDTFPAVPDRVALTVSGHTHGGQVAVPVLRRKVIPSRFGERYARGHIVQDGRHLYVTAGFGTSGWPVRLLAPAEVVILALRPEAAPPRVPDAPPHRGRGPIRAAGRRRSRAPAPRSR
ncbi:MAG TPA: metallophosphoesterase [Solirubrobacteraceae bacterium]|nr:metallophosphoesterase [Solirubrobacteraceae bacterium]